jgi:ferritin-like protein
VATGSASFHESPDDLQPATRDRHRAIVSLQEELEAVDWYDQRIDATGDEDLREILRHNRDEEKEHASMVLEWLRRQDTEWDGFLRMYLFTERPVAELAAEAETEVEAATEVAATPAGTAGTAGTGDGSLGLRGLADKEML